MAGTYYADNDVNNIVLPYEAGWLDTIEANSNLAQLTSLSYDPSHRGITTANLAGRVLPTEQHAYLNPTLPGEGDTFDYLQMSAVWVGTPVYVIATTNDQEWDLVLTPDFIAWVKSSGVAMADKTFIQSWSEAAQRSLVAITQTTTPLQDANGNLLSLAYVGSVFPKGHSSSTIMMPVADSDRHAVVQEIVVAPEAIAEMPLSLTPHNMATLMGTLIGRPYGWGGMNFDNDCSAEMKSLFTPFGIYLPRHSSDQVTVGAMIDESAATPVDRLAFLQEKGKPFLSLIYIGGHVVLYTGSNLNPYDVNQQFMAMTYQNLWGLGAIPPNPNKRFIIGGSVFLPMLLQYPEVPTANSEVTHAFFQICDLSLFPEAAAHEALQEMELTRIFHTDPAAACEHLMDTASDSNCSSGGMNTDDPQGRGIDLPKVSPQGRDERSERVKHTAVVATHRLPCLHQDSRRLATNQYEISGLSPSSHVEAPTKAIPKINIHSMMTTEARLDF